MRELLHEIVSDAAKLLSTYKQAILHVVRPLLVFLLIALAVEVFVFNCNYFATKSYDPIDLSSQLSEQLEQNEDGDYLLTTTDHTVTFHDLNCRVNNFKLTFNPDQEGQVISVNIHFTDDGHGTYFDTNEYSVGVPDAQVATNNQESQYVKVKAAGYVQELRLDFAGDDISYPIALSSVQVNAPCPFSFQPVRFILLVLVLGLLWFFRPRSRIYRVFIHERPRLCKVVIGSFVAVELVIMCCFTLFNSAAVGIATPSYNTGSWDGKNIVNTFEVGGDNAQQYAELAKSFTGGELYLEEQPPEWLTEMDDPYDTGLRDELVKETGEGYLWDVAYYDNHYYVYFGVVPVLVFYLPFYLLTGANFPSALGVLISCMAFVVGLVMLLGRFAQYHFKRVSLGLFLLLQAPMVLCSGVLYLLKSPTFYAVPIMLGLALSVWGLYFWMRGRSSKRPELFYLAGSLCMGLVLGCRPQLCVLSLVAFPLFWRMLITEGHIRTKAGLQQFCCLIAPYLAVFVFIGWYNAARFGSPLNFGANYNLTMNDMTKRGFDVGRLAPALFAYFLQTPATTGVFPYLQPVTFDTTYMGQTIREVTYGGIFACLPVLWLLIFAKRALAMRNESRSTRTVSGVVGVLVASGFIVAIADAQMAGILQRYYADFSFMFLAAVVLVIFAFNETLSQGSEVWKIALRVLIVLVALSVLYSVLTCLVAETGWISDSYAWAYQGLLETFQFWK
ncbi:MAG: cytochrome C oxidase Cbb3 [Eggerthellaceae bacterium]